MKRTCKKCNGEFELKPDHPGLSVVCRDCIADPNRLSKLNGKIVLNGDVYVKVGLRMESEEFE